MSSFEIVAAGALDPARLHAAFTAAFADYLIGPFELAPAQWPQFLMRQGVELAESRVAVQRGEPIAFCLAAPRPEVDSWRLGTMGALPAARGSGAAPALLDDFVARAQAAGVRSVELECFAQNTRALRLYEGRGFREVDALHGWRHAGGSANGSTDIPVSIELPDAFAWLDACPAAGIALPLQVTPRSLRGLPVTLQAWRRGQAQLVFSEGADARLHVHSLVDRVPAQQDARALVAALLARYPRQAIQVPQLQRQVVGGAALESLGFERLPLHQLWLRRPLA
jgi:ribosomal protein S18 acetylase RimI-like enzyme